MHHVSQSGCSTHVGNERIIMGEGQGDHINTVNESTETVPFLTWKCLGVRAQVNPVWAIWGHHLLYTQVVQCDGAVATQVDQLARCSGSNMWSYLIVFGDFRHGPAGEGVLLRVGFGFLDPFQPFPVLLLDLQRRIMLWVSSLRGVRVESPGWELDSGTCWLRRQYTRKMKTPCRLLMMVKR